MIHKFDPNYKYLGRSSVHYFEVSEFIFVFDCVDWFYCMCIHLPPGGGDMGLDHGF